MKGCFFGYHIGAHHTHQRAFVLLLCKWQFNARCQIFIGRAGTPTQHAGPVCWTRIWLWASKCHLQHNRKVPSWDYQELFSAQIIINLFPWRIDKSDKSIFAQVRMVFFACFELKIGWCPKVKDPNEWYYGIKNEARNGFRLSLMALTP